MLHSRFCSWCFQKSDHVLKEDSLVLRNVYSCMKCKKRTLECRYCKHMAKGDSAGWDDELCAEHAGAIASFARLDMKLSELSDFRRIFERDSVNMRTVGITAVGMVAGCAVMGPAALYAGPAIASSLGAAGFLGAAGTGTAISSLSGAALGSASLAAIGGGTMAAGTAVITAAGSALGGYYGGIVSNSYYGQVKNFAIRKVQGGNKHAVVFVNGFLSENNHSVHDWTRGLADHFGQNHWYHLDWEANTLSKLGAMLRAAPREWAKGMAKTYAVRASRFAASRLNVAGAALTLADIANNPWHVSMMKAELTGIMLADAIARTPNWRFTLAGHSLGARVIYYALQALATRKRKPVRDVYLLGGAVSNDSRDWALAASSVGGRLYNCHSDNDSVLKYLYQGANAGLSKPIGFAPIGSRTAANIIDFDCSAVVNGHLAWKEALPDILWSLHGEAPAASRRRKSREREEIATDQPEVVYI